MILYDLANLLLHAFFPIILECLFDFMYFFHEIYLKHLFECNSWAYITSIDCSGLRSK